MQEVLSAYKKMETGNLNIRSSKRLANVLTLFQVTFSFPLLCFKHAQISRPSMWTTQVGPREFHRLDLCPWVFQQVIGSSSSHRSLPAGFFDWRVRDSALWVPHSSSCQAMVTPQDHRVKPWWPQNPHRHSAPLHWSPHLQANSLRLLITVTTIQG